MGKIEIYFSETEEATGTLARILRDMDVVEGALLDLTKQVSPAVQARYEIGPRLRACAQEAEAIRDEGAQIRRVVREGVRAYRELETALEQEATDLREITVGGRADI
ncbi:hypothetical protein [uncultured Intestinimonas sp.]|uniref:hypothetical protein n=1 Tax=uncultured Intestinimonas sp. TaxID=1689265 RepID=UPI0025EE0455|nr:hypothetical protein [uncultured Intestinimonas sp.]